MTPVLERFLAKISISKIHFYKKIPCWEWNAYIGQDGYGQFKLNGKMKYAHRVSYKEFKGKIPEELQIDHLCRNRSCINPEHLEAVTAKENCRRGLTGSNQTTKTHCPKGHPYSEENTYIRPKRHRECKACHRIQVRQYKQRKKLEKNLI